MLRIYAHHVDDELSCHNVIIIRVIATVAIDSKIIHLAENILKVKVINGKNVID